MNKAKFRVIVEKDNKPKKVLLYSDKELLAHIEYHIKNGYEIKNIETL